MAETQTVEIPIRGMDCAECTQHVQHALAALTGVESVDVFLASEKAVVRLDPARVGLPAMQRAVEAAGYSLGPASAQHAPDAPVRPGLRGIGQGATRSLLTLLGVVFGTVLFVVVVGEWLGVFEALTERVPFPVGLAIVLAAGLPVFRNVVRATLRGQVIAHTLMSVGVLAALAVGQWATAAVVVFFMRVGDYAERFTTGRARRAVRDLTALAPQTARVLRGGQEHEVALAEVQPGEVVIVRPGENIPVDGEVVGGHATVDQSAITGESMPVEAGPGARVFAASFARLGSLRVRALRVGPDSTFGRVIKLVEQAEANRANVQRVADRFSGYYLPIVAAIAALTFLLRRDPLATAAVLVVACSCSFALATPIAILASVGAAARRGLLIKGGKYLETLARADAVLIDKTGTLTLGQPQITDVIESPLTGSPQGAAEHSPILRLAASAERYSEHPLAEAVRAAARARGLELDEPHEFEALPGLGVRARLNGTRVSVGNRRLATEAIAMRAAPGDGALRPAASQTLFDQADRLEAQGKTVLFVAQAGELAGLLAASDTLRAEVPAAIAELRGLGVRHIELLTGDNERTASALAEALGIAHRASLLPEDKIAIVREYQAQGHTVVMVGDGINDAPALAQADVGIAMGAAGSDVALEAAHIALLRDDWRLVPDVLRIARRTMRVVRLNIAFTAVYNLVGLSLAAMGLLPPVFAAAAQSLPDLGILANSTRLLRQK